MDTWKEQEVELRMLNQEVDKISMKVHELERKIDDVGQLPSGQNSSMQELMRQLGTISTLGERRENEDVDVMLSAQEAARAQMARDISDELNRVDIHLEQLKLCALQNCRKFTPKEKAELAGSIIRFAEEDINKALKIIAEDDPNIQTSRETVQVDMDNLSESTLWKLKFFVIDTLLAQSSAGK